MSRYHWRIKSSDLQVLKIKTPLKRIEKDKSFSPIGLRPEKS